MSDLPIKIKLPEEFLNEETRNDYLISTKYKELWAVELDLLATVDAVCKKHSIPYYACAGTMLGAVRHHGIIPWDDDIDIMLLRKDYDKLCSYANEFNEPYFFQTEDNDKGHMRGHAQLRNSLTTGILEDEIHEKYSFNQGIFIDIFPLDNLPDNDDERKKYIENLKQQKNNCKKIRDIPTHSGESNSELKNVARAMISPFLKVTDSLFCLTHKLFLKYDADLKKYQSSNTKRVGILPLADLIDRFNWDRSDFEGEVEYVPFEFLSIPLPKGYLNMLVKSYGEWNKPVKVGTNHGGLIFDCRIPYKEYMQRL